MKALRPSIVRGSLKLTWTVQCRLQFYPTLSSLLQRSWIDARAAVAVAAPRAGWLQHEQIGFEPLRGRTPISMDWVASHSRAPS